MLLECSILLTGMIGNLIARPLVLQLAVIASMESSEYYKCLDDPLFMNKFDVRMTYHRTSEVPLTYWSQRCDLS